MSDNSLNDDSAQDHPDNDVGRVAPDATTSDTGGQEGIVTRNRDSLAPVYNEINNLRNSLKLGRRSRYLVLLLLVAFVGYFGNKYYKFMYSFTTEEFQQTLKDRAEDHFFGGKDPEEELTRVGNELASSTAKVMEQAVRKQLDEDMPGFQEAVAKERDSFATNLEDRLNQLVEEHYAHLLSRHDKVLREKFPDFNEEQMAKMIANLDSATNRVLSEFFVDEIRMQMDMLYRSYDEFPVAPQFVPGSQVGTIEDALFKKFARVASDKLAEVAGDE